MSKKARIIVSISGIVLVMLILVGLTFAYFLTRINGNTNDKSISVSTAKLELTYGDNSAEILGKDLVLEPSDTEIGTKTFTVTNKGNNTSYVVVIENVSVTKASDGSTTTFESNDFRYTLTCTKKDGTSCDGVSTQSVFPINGGVLVGNSIKEGDVHTYTFKMWYIDTGIDQSNDMGKSLQARLNITNLSSMTNPYLANTNSLAYNIIENTKSKANGTEFLNTPKTLPAHATSSILYLKGIDPTAFTSSRSSATNYYISYADDYTVNETTGKFTLINPTVATSKYTTSMASSLVGKYAVWGTSTPTATNTQNQSSIYKISTNVSDITSTIKYANVKTEQKSTEKELSTTQDDYGTSYYYRGNVIDNYVNFAGMCWRAVRIAGDGSIKLILEDQDSTCATSDGNWNIPTTTGGTTKTGNFGYTQHAANTLTASDGTKNSSAKYLMNYLNGGTNKDKSMATAFKNFQTGPLANYLDKLKAGDWCLNDKAYASRTDNTTPLTSQEILDKQIKSTTFHYDARVRLYGKTTKEPTLKCNGTNMSKFADNTDMYVGTLTADEIVYAGGKVSTINPDYYLINDYQKSNGLYFWSLSPNRFNGSNDIAFFVFNDGRVNNDGYVNDSYGSFRPAVSLKSSVQITGGNGTKANAYTIG